MFFKALLRGFLAVAMLTSTVAIHADVFNMGSDTNLQFVTVGDTGNAADPATGSLYGSVPYAYQMGKYDVTVGQYCQFLNAVAKTHTYSLYNSGMATAMPTIGISRSGSSGSYSYSVTGSYSQAANCPIFDVSWGDAARFCNWLQNGQPTGSQGLATTEDGSYYLNGARSSSAFMAITRKASATYVIPSENEWYKASYYDPNKPGGAGYWSYPTLSNSAPSNTLSSTDTNNANFFISYGPGAGGLYTDPTNYLTPVGTFAASPGPYGTYDMGGDVWQWNDTAVTSASRGMRGGRWNAESSYLASSSRVSGGYPALETSYLGFRVACVPEPCCLVMTAIFAATALLYFWRKHV
jgi:formylglycine-generating enzyme